MRPIVVGVLCLTTISMIACRTGNSRNSSATLNEDSAGAASEGELCGNGVFGSPNIACGSGLVCEYPTGSSTPQGPTGSSSATTGVCRKPLVAVWGEMCGNGILGSPNIPCAAGLECKYPNHSTGPNGPQGSSSAATGVCRFPGAQIGESCANGSFGTPNIPCARSLTCTYPGGSNAPNGPTGSSSAVTGVCKDKGAKLNKMCANGVLGTPNQPCQQDLVCVYPQNSTTPQGPAGSSSAATGTCKKPAKRGEVCGTGVFGSPNIPCVLGLSCKFAGGSSAPNGPSGSSSAVVGTCEAN